MIGDHGAAGEAYRTAAARTTNTAQQRYLYNRAAQLSPDPPYELG